MQLTVVHIVAAFLSAWRITELFTMDRITERFRNRFPLYLWTCPRCMSVWAGVAAAAMLYFVPFLNWPLAMSWLYVFQMSLQQLIFKGIHGDRQITITADDQFRLTVTTKFSNDIVLGIVHRLLAELTAREAAMRKAQGKGK